MPPVSESLPKPVAAPERSLVQRMEALQRANDIRSRRAQLKRDLKAGRQPIHELLLQPPDYLAIAPEIILTIFGLGILLIDFMLERRDKFLNAVTALLGLGFAAAKLLIWMFQSQTPGAKAAHAEASEINAGLVDFVAVENVIEQCVEPFGGPPFAIVHRRRRRRPDPGC